MKIIRVRNLNFSPHESIFILLQKLHYNFHGPSSALLLLWLLSPLKSINQILFYDCLYKDKYIFIIIIFSFFLLILNENENIFMGPRHSA